MQKKKSVALPGFGEIRFFLHLVKVVLNDNVDKEAAFVI